MTMRISTGMRNRMLDGGAAGGVKGALNLCKINMYQGSQPASADAGATGTLLGTVTVNGAGTGLTWDAAVAGVISKAAAEVWRFTGLADGIAGWFRIWPAGDTPTNASSTAPRIDGAIANSGAEINLSNVNIVTGVVTTVDNVALTLPAG